jgi:hypothetical protein
MRRSIWIFFAVLLLAAPLQAKTVVFWQEGFPTVSSQPLSRATLDQALSTDVPVYADESALNTPATLADADLLVLPYGSALPASAWKSIERYLNSGGNLLVIGGQPLRVPVRLAQGKYAAAAPQDTYARVLDLRHTYEVPVASGARFQWKDGMSWLTPVRIRARRFFAVEGRLDGLGYMTDATGLLVAAPVIVANHWSARMVALDFEPEVGYWDSADGRSLIGQAASYARQGIQSFSIETLHAALRPGEAPLITVHLHTPQKHAPAAAATPAAKAGDAAQNSSASAGNGTVEIKLQLASEKEVQASATLHASGAGSENLDSTFHQPLAPGFYTVTGVLSSGGQEHEFARNGFWVEERSKLAEGPALGVHGDFLTLDGQPYFPVGSNYFSTESNGWDFSGPRNAAVWERDFAAMEAHGVSFVRTGVWMPNGRFIESNGGVNERFLRNVEGFLACAHRHHMVVNFTFFAFSPHSGNGPGGRDSGAGQPNPYLDSLALDAQKAYIRSVVSRFQDLPWLSWDLINEPSVFNPTQIFHGNVPNADPTEIAAWRKWLGKQYPSLDALAEAWRVTPESLGSFDAIPLPTLGELRYERSGNPNLVRAVDYNLFAQQMFVDWVKAMVATIRGVGSTQSIDVGQDEGGVTDRVLNQFYGGAGVAFTTNHTYWQDDALLWDSIAAKRPGTPNITGETGYQPTWNPDGSWRYDEFTGLGITERKWALGFAAGSSGAVQWDWDREVDFGMLRSDGSSKVWENQMRALGGFARQAAPFATSLMAPDVALVLPQSLQLSVGNSMALDAQQSAVRALYGYARSAAYAVGEHQIERLGNPKLILLPAAYGLTDEAWKAIEEKVRGGAILLASGPFAGDQHLHATSRAEEAGLPYQTVPLHEREIRFRSPAGEALLTYPGMKTTVLDRAMLAGSQDWIEKPLGKGRILFSALPLELNSNLAAVGAVYRYALQVAHVEPIYTTTLDDPGLLICPTLYPKATLYVLTSESNRTAVSFTDRRSGKTFSGNLASGHAAILLVGTGGELLASYNWPEKP